MASREEAAKAALEGAKKIKGLLGGLLGGGGKTAGKTTAKEAEALLRGLPKETVADVARNVRTRPGRVTAFGPSKSGAPGAGLPVNKEVTAQRQAIEVLLQKPRGRRTLASITGEFPELPAGVTPRFRDLSTQSLLARGKSLEPRTLGDIAQGAKGFAAARPKTSLVLGGLGGLSALSIGAGVLGGPDEGDQLSQSEILNIISKSGVGQSTEDYLKGLAEQQISGLSGASSLPPELQTQLDERQMQYENALIDANRRYLEAIGAGADIPAASMSAYGQGAQAAQAAAEADTGTAVSGLVPVSGALAATPELIREEGARQAALEQIVANTAAGSDQRARDLAVLAGAESVGRLRSDYENLLLAQRIQDFRNRQAAEQQIQQDLFAGLSEIGLQRVKSGEGVGSAGYVDKINEYVVEYESLSDTQRAALAEVNGINNAADYATTRLRQDYGV